MWPSSQSFGRPHIAVPQSELIALAVAPFLCLQSLLLSRLNAAVLKTNNLLALFRNFSFLIAAAGFTTVSRSPSPSIGRSPDAFDRHTVA